VNENSAREQNVRYARYKKSVCVSERDNSVRYFFHFHLLLPTLVQWMCEPKFN